MELIIQKSTDTPFINFSISKRVFEIGGKSLPEDAEEFYRPVFEWLKKNNSSINSESTIEFKLDYFNTASSKRIFDIISFFKDIHESGRSVTFKWYYSKDDKDMLSAGEEIEEIMEIDFMKIQM